MRFFVWLLNYAVCLGCKYTIVRKSVNDMSDGELQVYFDGLGALNSGPKPTRWQKLIGNVDFNRKDFLPAHREILFQVEKAIQKKNPNVTVPYWDCLPYRSHAAKDPSLSSSAFGYMTGCAGGRLEKFLTSEGKCIHRNEIHNFCPNYPLVESNSRRIQDPLVYAKTHLPILQYLVQTIYTTEDPSIAIQDPLMLSYMANMDRYWDAWLTHNSFTTALHGGQHKYPAGPSLLNSKTARKIVQVSAASCVRYAA
ncbi:hypothetical protein DSO57_1012321 [Entomophthora muscae]|uniref:Uncharacterized protein n=1 Tax=Entomophthora muscae TaxID=34485 RepID=A0ACC2U405_9FUNG|nr:hypothetical protein DSO57_1012321 [Entomophthora muscae]